MEYYDFKVFAHVSWQFMTKFAPWTCLFRCATAHIETGAIYLKAGGYTWKLAYLFLAELDISISFPNIQKYFKKLKNWGRRCNLKFTKWIHSERYTKKRTDGHSLKSASPYEKTNSPAPLTDYCGIQESKKSSIYFWIITSKSAAVVWRERASGGENPVVTFSQSRKKQ